MGERRHRFSRFYHRRKVDRHRHDRFHRLVLMSMLVWWAFAIGDVVVFTLYSFGSNSQGIVAEASGVKLPVGEAAQQQSRRGFCIDVIVEKTGEIKTPALLEDAPASVLEQTGSWELFLSQDDRDLRYEAHLRKGCLHVDQEAPMGPVHDVIRELRKRGIQQFVFVTGRPDDPPL